MFSRVTSAAIHGVSIEMVGVETDVGDGLPVFDMVGLLNSEVKESKERVRTAIKNSKVKIPPRRITVNLSPADLRKEGGSFDLPIAVGILSSIGIITSVLNMEETLIVGELSLDGRINRVKGVLPIVISGKKKGIKNFIVPKENAREGGIIKGVTIVGAETLSEVINILNGMLQIKPESVDINEMYENNKNAQGGEKPDFSEIHGQDGLKRAAEVAAAGMHNMFLIGPPGAGKSMLASRIPTILPDPDIDECIEITKIHSIAGTLGDVPLMMSRPFRSPHHSITARAFIGGGGSAKPGEITLAHKGVLFLDEFPEFKRDTIDSLRQPMENGRIDISRVHGNYEFPCNMMVVAAANPCKCGYYPDRRRCSCTDYEVRKYLDKISGPVIDRMDICVGAPPVEVQELEKYKKAESSEKIRKRVEAARYLQKERYKGTEIKFNSELTTGQVKKYCYIGEKEKKILRQAFESFGMSARAYYKTIKVARTIADLSGSLQIRENHIYEAIGYRMTLEGGRK